MSILKLFIIVFIVSSLSACMSFIPIHFEFKLNKCPPLSFKLPEKISTSEWEAEAYENNECQELATYSFWERHSSISKGKKGDGNIFAKLVIDTSCSLHVGISYPKLCGDTPLAKCEVFNSKQLVAEEFAKTILNGQSFSVNIPAWKIDILSEKEAYEKWCRPKK